MKRLSIVGAAVLFAACLAEETIGFRHPEPTLQAVALEFGDQIWLGEFEEGTLVRDHWVNPPSGPIVGPFHLDISRLSAFSCCSSEGGDTGYHIVGLDLRNEGLRRHEYSLGYEGKQWASLGTLLHVSAEASSPAIHVVQPTSYDSVDPTYVIDLPTNAIGSTELHLSTNEKLLLARVGAHWAGIASMSQGVWRLTHVLPDESPVHGGRVSLGNRKAVIWGTDRQSLVIAELTADGLISEQEAAVSFPLDQVWVSPYDTIALLSESGDEGPYRILHLETGTIHPLDTRSRGPATLLSRWGGVRIVWGLPTTSGGVVSIPWTDLGWDGTLAQEGKLVLSLPHREVHTPPMRSSRVPIDR